MRKNLCQRLSYFKGCIHCSSYIGYRSTHFYACTGTKTITLNILNFYIGCFGSSVKCYEAGSKTVKFKDTNCWEWAELQDISCARHHAKIKDISEEP